MKKITETMESKSIEELCELFSVTNNNNDSNIPTVRGWIMDELERRNSSKFNKWMETEDINDMDSPELFFT